MREDLLGYLLGALEPDEMQQIGEALAQDPALRAELDQLRAALRPLEQADEIFEPPCDLVSGAMAAIPPRDPHGHSGADSLAGTPGASSSSPACSKVVSTSGMSPSAAERRGGQTRLSDMFATMAAGVLLAGLILPGILRERAAARGAACQSQLRQAGIALFEYLNRSPDQRFPELELWGPEAFSGRYALVLADAGLISRDRPLWCPSREVPTEWVGRPLPTSEQVREAGPLMLAVYQNGIGGDYAYHLGHWDEGRYVAPQFAARPRFAILGDAPIYQLDGWTAPHEGRGFNFLYEDGHVGFVSESDTGMLGDNPFLNRNGEIEAGLDPNDATLGPSHASPITPEHGW